MIYKIFFHRLSQVDDRWNQKSNRKYGTIIDTVRTLIGPKLFFLGHTVLAFKIYSPLISVIHIK